MIMSFDEHNVFDAGKLEERKRHHAGYRYCPFCASALEELPLDGRERMACSSGNCDFVFYHNPVPAAGAIIVEHGKVLLVRRAHPPRIGDWCLPAGFMEWSEHPSATALREVEEESGLKIKIRSLFEIYSGSDDPRTNAILTLYLADIVGGTLLAGDDAMEVGWFGLDDLPDNIAFASHRQALADYKQRFSTSPG
jgi:8-oxo-dGTP diphosphatase